MKILVFLFVILFKMISTNSSVGSIIQEDSNVITDCNYTFEEAISGIEIPRSIINQITLIDVEYYSFDNKLHKGQILLNKKSVEDIKEIFEFIKASHFPVAKVIPVVKYNWSDQASMSDNNTSAFNYRKVKGYKVLSPHSYGLAIDFNPLLNPHIKGKAIQPVNAKYDIKEPGTILRDSKLVSEFRKKGWQWGGLWRSSKDYQHFEKKN